MTTTPLPTALPWKSGASVPTPQGRSTTNVKEEGFFGDDGFTFEDVLDLINPLQHIPIVSTVYRAMTGDKISTWARVLEGGLFGGIAGLMGAVVNAIVADATGKDIGEHAIAMIRGLNGIPEAPDAGNAQPILRDDVGLNHGMNSPVGTSPSLAPTSSSASGGTFETRPTRASIKTDVANQTREHPPTAGAAQIRTEGFDIAARFGNRESAIDWVLLVLEQALDEHEGGALRAHRKYWRGSLAQGRPTGAVNTVV